MSNQTINQRTITSNFDSLLLTQEQLFLSRVQNLIPIIVFRRRNYHFSLEKEDYQQFQQMVKNIKIDKLNIDFADILLENDAKITVHNLQDNQSVQDVKPNDFCIIQGLKFAKIMRALNEIQFSMHNRFFAYQLEINRFNFDFDNNEGIHCVKSLRRLLMENDDLLGRLRVACYKEISNDDIFAKICELTPKYCIEYTFMTNDGSCAEIRALK